MDIAPAFIYNLFKIYLTAENRRKKLNSKMNGFLQKSIEMQCRTPPAAYGNAFIVFKIAVLSVK
jgi:hypothetical protein